MFLLDDKMTSALQVGLGITEPKSGLTLQAEIVNTLIYPRPYYVVTLSKALGFQNLGSIFAPITSRP
jgi:hypothetical protein